MENKGIILNALELTKNSLSKFIEKTFIERFGNNWENALVNGPIQEIEMNGKSKKENDVKYRDLNFYISSFLSHWSIFLKNKFHTNFPLTLCHTVKHYRNKWAHQSSFNSQETYRIVDACINLVEELGENSLALCELAKVCLNNFFNDIKKGDYNNMGKDSISKTENSNNNDCNKNMSNISNMLNMPHEVKDNFNYNNNFNNNISFQENQLSTHKENSNYNNIHFQQLDFQFQNSGMNSNNNNDYNNYNNNFNNNNVNYSTDKYPMTNYCVNEKLMNYTYNNDNLNNSNYLNTQQIDNKNFNNNTYKKDIKISKEFKLTYFDEENDAEMHDK